MFLRRTLFLSTLAFTAATASYAQRLPEGVHPGHYALHLTPDLQAATFAGQENKRYTDLATTGYGSVQNAQQAQSRSASAEATLIRDGANLTSAEKQVDLLKAEIVQANAALSRATIAPNDRTASQAA